MPKIWTYTLGELAAAAPLANIGPAAGDQGAQAPFAGVDKIPFSRGPFECQVAVSATARSKYLAARRHDNPTLPLTGDGRSGIIVFDGDKIIGSLTTKAKAMFTRPQHLLYVDPAYRGQGLATEMWAFNIFRYPEFTVLSNPVHNIAGRKTLIRAYRRMIEMAQQQGIEVPFHALESAKPGHPDERKAYVLQNGRSVYAQVAAGAL